jgi:hypothetical protein
VNECAVLLAVPDRVEPEYGRLFDRVEIAKPNVQPVGTAPDGAHDDALGRLPVAGHDGRVDAFSKLAEPDEVRVGIEDDQAQRRLQQELLEDRAEGVRFPRARLPAEERVAIEAASVEREAHAWAEGELTYVERRPSRPGAVEPIGDGHSVCSHDRDVVEGSSVSVEENPVAARKRDAEMRRIGDFLAHGGDELRAFDPGRLDGVYLAEPPVDRGVAADLHREVVDRPLEREAAAVDRPGHCGHRGFKRAASRYRRGRHSRNSLDFPALAP